VYKKLEYIATICEKMAKGEQSAQTNGQTTGGLNVKDLNEAAFHMVEQKQEDIKAKNFVWSEMFNVDELKGKMSWETTKKFKKIFTAKSPETVQKYSRVILNLIYAYRDRKSITKEELKAFVKTKENNRIKCAALQSFFKRTKDWDLKFEAHDTTLAENQKIKTCYSKPEMYKMLKVF
jgi:hypothetical protein